jgi:EAL domain-containing protein (putative c-di-GMP-specific phosphodiesterase class I)
MLAGLGCPLGQGYHFSSPMGGTEVLSWLAGTRPVAA